MYVLILLLLPIVQVTCYHIPIGREIGSVLELFLGSFDRFVGDLLRFVRLKPRQKVTKSYWQEWSDYFGVGEVEPSEEELAADSLVVCNSFLFLAMLTIAFFYVLFAKKYFATAPHATPEFIPFMLEEDERSDYTSLLQTAPGKFCCECGGHVPEKGDT